MHTLRDGDLGHVAVVHPGALPARVHTRLAAALPERVGVVVLDLQGLPAYAQAALAGGDVGDASVTGIADTLAAALATTLAAAGRAAEAPPGTPFVLVGWSFGGVVAHEMASSPRLARAPQHLVLLDSISAATGYAATVEDLGDDVVLDWFEMYLGAKRARAAGPRTGRPATLGDVLDRGLRTGTLHPGTTLDGLRKAYTVFVDGLRRNTHLANPHAPRRCAVPATVVRAEVSLLAEAGALGYDRLVPPGAEVVTVPGDHYSMLDDPAAMDIVAAICERHLPPPVGTPAEAVPDRAHLESLP